jgi:hypothetical protein
MDSNEVPDINNTIPVLNNNIPAPPPTTLPGPTLESMNNYVKGFAPQHGYLISIGRSSLVKKPFCNYRCHRGGLPEISKDPTKESKSIKIQCPFKLKARYSSSTQTWILSHIETRHNHPPNFDIQPQPAPQLTSITPEVEVDTFISSLGQRIKALSVEEQHNIIASINNLFETVNKSVSIVPNTTTESVSV